MTSINTNIARVGNFTSSEIVALLDMGTREMTDAELALRPKTGKGSSVKTVPHGLGKAALTYIHECNMERRLGRSITDESNARPLSWGKLTEKKVFQILGTEYTFNSQETTVHELFNYWSGSADGFKPEEEKTVADFKCPMTLKSFCTLVDPLYNGFSGMKAMDAIRNGWKDLSGTEMPAHKDGEKFYQQLVSNSVINNCKYAELIVYMPYLSELQDIRELAQNADPQDLYKYFWIANGNDEELPHLIEGGYYNNINIIRFEVPQEDKDFLTERVKMGGKLLQDFHKI